MMWLLIAGIQETGEEYLCQLLDDGARGHDPPPSPIVRVLATLRYPRQRAIMQPETAHEIPPLGAGLICRLPALRALSPEEAARALRGDAFPPTQALDAAIREAGSEAEREILLRHQAGAMARGQRTVAFREWEWQRIRSNDAGRNAHALSDQGPGAHHGNGGLPLVR